MGVEVMGKKNPIKQGVNMALYTGIGSVAMTSASSMPGAFGTLGGVAVGANVVKGTLDMGNWKGKKKW